MWALEGVNILEDYGEEPDDVLHRGRGAEGVVGRNGVADGADGDSELRFGGGRTALTFVGVRGVGAATSITGGRDGNVWAELLKVRTSGVGASGLGFVALFDKVDIVLKATLAAGGIDPVAAVINHWPLPVGLNTIWFDSDVLNTSRHVTV